MSIARDLFQTDDFDVDSLYDDFLQVVINGGGYKGIADLLAHKLQASVLIEDEYFFVQARSFFNTSTFSKKARKKNGIKYWKPQYLDPRIIEYVRVLQSTMQPVAIPELPEYGISSARLVFPIVVKNRIKKYLNVFKKDLNWEQMKIVKAASYSLVVMETCRKAQMELKDQILKSLILGLISDKDDDSNLSRDKHVLGFDLSRESVFAVAQIEAAPGQWQIEEVLRSLIADLYLNACAIAINDEQAVLLLQPDEGDMLEPEKVNESLHSILEGLRMIFSGCNVKIGVGRQCYKPKDYKIAFEEACHALSLTDSKQENVIYYHSLRLMGVLMHPVNEQTLPAFVRRILGKLHDYGASHNLDLIESLECYLRNNCCIQSAARELFIHPNTLRYRLEKAERVSGLDLTDNDTKLELQLAIKLYRYKGDILWKA